MLVVFFKYARVFSAIVTFHFPLCKYFRASEMEVEILAKKKRGGGCFVTCVTTGCQRLATKLRECARCTTERSFENRKRRQRRSAPFALMHLAQLMALLVLSTCLCGHSFCFKCITEWWASQLLGANQCPKCKRHAGTAFSTNSEGDAKVGNPKTNSSTMSSSISLELAATRREGLDLT